jgi:hypothetical protein
MHGPDHGPHRACHVVVLLHEDGDEQRVLLAHEEDFGRHADAGVGAKHREVRGTASQLPAEHESVRST